jgi:hypothetical protein
MNGQTDEDGSRPIVMDGVTCRRRRAYNQATCWSGCTCAVEHADHSGAVLVVMATHPHSGNLLGWLAVTVRPADVVQVIRAAVQRDWQPKSLSRPPLVDLAEDVNVVRL